MDEANRVEFFTRIFLVIAGFVFLTAMTGLVTFHGGYSFIGWVILTIALAVFASLLIVFLIKGDPYYGRRR